MLTTYADPRVCPSCREPLPQPLSPDDRCATCDVSLGHPRAAEVFAALQRVDTLVARLRAVSWEPAAHPAPTPVAPVTVAPAPAVVAEPVRTGIRTSSVPAVLLGLGALCLLVAAVIFLAVAWSWLGVGGRTAVLAGLTVATGAGGLALRARGLALAAEALVTVSLGMLVLDVLGAVHAGWLDVSGASLALGTGLVLAAGAGALVAVDGRLVVPQVVGVVGLFVAQAALADLVDRPLLVAALATVGLVGLVGLAGATRDHLRVAAWSAAAAATLAWLDLVLTALTRLGELGPLTAGDLWATAPGLSLLVAAALLLAPAAVVRHEVVTQVAATAAATTWTGVVALPVLDNGTTDVAVASLLLGSLWTLASYAVPRSRRAVVLVPAALSLVPATLVSLVLATQALATALSPTDDLRLDPAGLVASPWLLVPTAVALVVLLVVVVPGAARRGSSVRGVFVGASLAAVATLALHPVPLWTVVVAVCLAATGGAVEALRRDDATAVLQHLAAASALLGAVVLALPSTWLLTVPLVLLVAVSAAAMLTGRFASAAETGGLLLVPSAAALTWVLGDLAGLTSVRAVPVLVVVAALAIGRPRAEVELPAAIGGAIAAFCAVPLADDLSVSTALHLTLAGALLVVHALVHPSRRPVAWVGTALLVLATWVRLADLGVTAPEAYTMPTAVLLLAVGLLRMRRDAGSSTALTLTPGLLLATVPTFLHVAATAPVSQRAALLGIGCLLLTVGGAQLRWSAPLVVGAVVGGLLTLVELAPYAAETPQWVVIALAGTTLVVVGTTWERRVVDLQRASSYVGRLR